MKLVPKLALALFAGVVVVVAGFTGWRVRRDIELFDDVEIHTDLSQILDERFPLEVVDKLCSESRQINGYLGVAMIDGINPRLLQSDESAPVNLVAAEDAVQLVLNTIGQICRQAGADEALDDMVTTLGH